MTLKKLFFTALCVALAMLVQTGSTQAAQAPVVVIETSLGDITVSLNQARAPVSVENFLTYVKDGFYDGTIFHRVIRNFMVQGGGLTAQMQKKPTRPPIKNEAANGLKNERGTLAMARTGEVDSATSQFFINTKENKALDHKVRDFGYAVFGEVIDGMDVVDAIEKVKTQNDVPVEPVVIKTIRLKTE